MLETHDKRTIATRAKFLLRPRLGLLRPRLRSRLGLLRPPVAVVLGFFMTPIGVGFAEVDIEAELAIFSTELEQLNRAIDANQTLFEKRAINDKNQVAKRNLMQAQSLSESGDILAARYALSDFITDIQTLNPSDGAAYSELLIHTLRQTGQNNAAFEHYLQYLQYTLQTEKTNKAKITKILTNLSNLAAAPHMDASTLRHALPVLRIVSQTDEYKNAALFVCARIANEIGFFQITADFLDEMDFTKKADLVLQDKSRFFRALIDLRLGHQEQALNRLDELLAKKLSDESLMAMALLARGRIMAERKQFSEALRSYDKIPTRSPFYHDALYEKVITAAEGQDYANAKLAAQKLLSTFPHSIHTYRVRSLLSYIDLKQHNFKAAESNIQSLLTVYNKTAKTVQKTANPDVKQFASLVADLRLHLSPPPEWLDMIAMDKDLDQYESRAHAAEAQIRAFTYELGAKSFATLEPHLTARLKKHNENGQRLVSIAVRLAEAQTNLYDRTLLSHDKIRLHHIDKVLGEAIQKRSSYQILPQDALALGQYLTYIQKLRTVSSRIAIINAKIAAMRFNAPPDSPIHQVTHAGSSLVSKHKTLLTRINHLYLKKLPHLSSYYAGQKQFTREAMLLIEKTNIITSYSQKMESRTARLLNKGFDKAWAEWTSSASNYLRVGQRLEDTMQDRANSVVGTLQRLLASSYEAHRKTNIRRLALQDILTRYWPTYKAIALERLQEEIVRQKKWLADLNSEVARQELSKQQESLNRLQVEQEILLDKMTINLSGDSLSW